MTDTAQNHYIRIQVDSALARKQLPEFERRLKKTQTAAERMRKAMVQLNGAIALFVGANIMGSMVKGAVRMVDSYNELGGRINLVARETVGLAQAQKDLNAVALATYTQYDAVGALYARTGLAAKGMGLEHEKFSVSGMRTSRSR